MLSLKFQYSIQVQISSAKDTKFCVFRGAICVHPSEHAINQRSSTMTSLRACNDEWQQGAYGKQIPKTTVANNGLFGNNRYNATLHGTWLHQRLQKDKR